jgi:hypothetical protein
MALRVKARVVRVTESMNGAKRVRFTTEADDTIAEDQRIQQLSTVSSFDVLVDNPSTSAKFKLGDYYYVSVALIKA